MFNDGSVLFNDGSVFSASYEPSMLDIRIENLLRQTIALSKFRIVSFFSARPSSLPCWT
jgi:hypothetical protein